MYILIFNQILTDNTILSICWMLIHSIWIGLALSILAGLIILFTQNKSAVIRYNLLITSLLIFLINNVYMLIYELSFQGITIKNQSKINNSVINIFKNLQTNNFTITQKSIDFLNENADYIVNIWMIFIFFSLVRSIFDFYTIRQFKNKNIFEVEITWQNKLNEMAKNIHINRLVQIFESGYAKTPMVLGYLKPVILFPMGLMAALSPHEIEAILLHELGHIKRNDFLVNILQCILETLFFFNPFVWWVSALVRTERENCCDDFAISLTNNTKNYIQALVSFQEFKLTQPKYSMGLLKNRNQLMQRVLRLVTHKNTTLNHFERTIVTFCLSVLAVFIFVSSNLQAPFLLKQNIEFARIGEKTKSKKVPKLMIINKIKQIYDPIQKTEKNSAKPKEHTITYSIESTTTKTVNTDGKITNFITKTKPLTIQLKTNNAENSSKSQNILAEQLVKNYQYDAKIQKQIESFINQNLTRKTENSQNVTDDSLNNSKRKFSKNKIGINTEVSKIDFDKFNRGLLKYDGVIRYFADSYEVVMKNKEIKAVYFEGNKIPDEKITNYSEKIKEVIKKAIT